MVSCHLPMGQIRLFVQVAPTHLGAKTAKACLIFSRVITYTPSLPLLPPKWKVA